MAAPPVTEADLRKAFWKVDAAGGGRVDGAQLKAFLARRGESEPSDAELRDALVFAGAGEGGRMDVDQFIRSYMAGAVPPPPRPPRPDEDVPHSELVIGGENPLYEPSAPPHEDEKEPRHQ